MKCPNCNHFESNVIDTRIYSKNDENTIKRRRLCKNCKEKFTTFETVKKPEIFIKKRDGSVEKFNRDKIMHGLVIACRKRKISTDVLDLIISNVEKTIQISNKKEFSSKVLGDLILKELKKIDEVAYIRFASVYKEFETLADFKKELENLEKKE